MIATAPGKILLAGEYAVLEGAEAVVMGVDRRVVASIVGSAGQDLSPFLAAARDVIADELGARSAAAHAASRVAVDSDALALPAGPKLGLGSSAASTVAAIGCALAAAGGDASPGRVHELAHRAHARAQGGRGSGVDVAASAFGGLLSATPSPGAPPRLRGLAMPEALAWVAAFTGRAAHTPTLLAAADDARARRPAAFARAMGALGEASAALVSALERRHAGDALEAVAQGADAVAGLDAVMAAPLVLPAHLAIAATARELGGAAKPTGAAGGDLAIAAFVDPDAAERFEARMGALGIPAFSARPAPGVTVSP